MRIDAIHARSIPDTRGRPTIATTLVSEPFTASASVPSGKSTGSHEACELRDADGGVSNAIANVQGEITQKLVGHDFASADEIDTALIELDGTPDKSRLGANAILSVSIAAQRLFASSLGVPLWYAISERADTEPGAPRLYVNVINGGAHTDFKLPFQEYILVVEGATSKALPVAQAVFDKLGKDLGNVPMGDEGGYAPTFDDLMEPFELITAAMTGHPSMSIAIDAAASELYQDGNYQLIGTPYSADDLHHLYADLAERFHLHSIEDPFDEEASSDFARLMHTLGKKVLIVGDDFTVTNPKRIQAARDAHAINAVLIKPNQIGSVKEAIAAVRATYDAGWEVIASHRSGETDDTFIADFAYGVGAHGIKAGGFGQKERREKYERLLAIEEEAATV